MTAPAAPSLPPRAALPFEPGSLAELLSSSHLFTVEILSAQPTPWATGADGLEHRSIALSLRTLALLKGRLTVPAGETFSVTVPQRRENALVGSDYHGLWSHASPEPAPGVKYLVVATAADAAPAAPSSLLLEPACKMLHPADLASDVALAEQGEQHFQGALRAGGADAELNAASALLHFAGGQAAAAREPFSRYLWERIQPSVLRHAPGVRPALLTLLSGPATSPALRLTLLVGLERVLPDVQASDPRFLRDAGHTLATLLLEPAAKETHQRILTVSLFHLVFPDEVNAQVAAADVLPDAAERGRVADVLRASRDARAQKLLAWAER